jgi:hypothetical protein
VPVRHSQLFTLREEQLIFLASPPPVTAADQTANRSMLISSSILVVCISALPQQPPPPQIHTHTQTPTVRRTWVTFYKLSSTLVHHYIPVLREHVHTRTPKSVTSHTTLFSLSISSSATDESTLYGTTRKKHCLDVQKTRANSLQQSPAILVNPVSQAISRLLRNQRLSAMFTAAHQWAAHKFALNF